jgi:hypothetical protein
VGGHRLFDGPNSRPQLCILYMRAFLRITPKSNPGSLSSTTPPVISNSSVQDKLVTMAEGSENFDTLCSMMEKMGLNKEETVDDWKKVGKGSQELIMRHGPREAAKYEVRKASVTAAVFYFLAENFKAQFVYGEMMEQGRFLYDSDHFNAILGVAWFYGKTEYLEKDRGKRRYPVTYVKVRWEIDSEFKTSWETRATIHRLFNNEYLAEKAIHLVAQIQDRRYQEVEDRSPTQAADEGSGKEYPGLGTPKQLIDLT